MPDLQAAEPVNTAVRVALWRALHVAIDPPPQVFHDEVGLKLAAPEAGWRDRPDMSPFTKPFRAPDDMLALPCAAGFREVRHVSSGALRDRYFADRTDGLRPPNHAEELLVATT